MKITNIGAQLSLIQAAAPLVTASFGALDSYEVGIVCSYEDLNPDGPEYNWGNQVNIDVSTIETEGTDVHALLDRFVAMGAKPGKWYGSQPQADLKVSLGHVGSEGQSVEVIVGAWVTEKEWDTYCGKIAQDAVKDADAAGVL